MTTEELEELKSDLRIVREAIDKHRPLLRDVASSNFLAVISLPFALLFLGFGIGTQVLIDTRGGFDALPGWWRVLFWIAAFLTVVGGGIIKIFFFNKRASEVGTGLREVMFAFWGREWIHLVLSSLVVFSCVSAFALLNGHPWYVLPAFSIWYGIYINIIAIVVRRLEYYAAGWFGVAAGALSLFTIENAPWLWLGVLIGGVLLLFGILGLLPQRGEPAGRHKTGATG
ncbi:MAG TPA: hypothetical protein VMV83_14460 [Rectinemataceae bacterium]|nr:hypothetical protein [Rectinemataceae bacterium]